MAKEEEDELKRVELKVSINCCEGCRRKVLKALNIKGVLKTEIHPSLPKITVTGNVDTRTLIKKLAKIGKSAELLPPVEMEPDQYNELENKSENVEKINSSDENNREIAKERNNTDDDGETITEPDQQLTNANSINAQEGNKVMNKEDEIRCGIKVGDEATIHEDYTKSSSYQTAYYSMMMPTTPFRNAVPYYNTMNVYLTPPPSWDHNQDHSLLPMYSPQQVQSQSQSQTHDLGFTDYFNDDNTVGCNLM